MTIIMIDAIRELMRGIPRSCQKHLIKEHFERLLRSYIMRVGDMSQKLFIFNWSCDCICGHRLTRLGHSNSNKIDHLYLEYP